MQKNASQSGVRLLASAAQDIVTVVHKVWKGLQRSIRVVLAVVSNSRFGSGSGLEPNWNHCNGVYPIKQQNRTEPAVFWLVPHFHKLRTLSAIKYLCSDHITILYVCKLCSFRCSFTSHSPICDLINIRWDTVKNTSFLMIFNRDSTNIDRITIWWTEGERASNIA
jgi:hypothetical protein